MTGDHSLKRLFEIYAQQRTRFAEELRQHLPAGGDTEDSEGFATADWQAGHECLARCMDSDLRTLQLYRQALANRDLPTRTHFLIASQFALLERAHERVSTLLKSEPNGRETDMKSLAGFPTRARA